MESKTHCSAEEIEYMASLVYTATHKGEAMEKMD